MRTKRKFVRLYLQKHLCSLENYCDSTDSPASSNIQQMSLTYQTVSSTALDLYENRILFIRISSTNNIMW